MGTNTNVPITAGAGTNVDTYQVASGDHQQIIREVRASAAAAINTWTPTTTGQATQIAADENRVGLLMNNASNVRVYLRFDSTIPTTTAYHWYLDAGDRWEVPLALCQLAVSMLGQANGTGNVNSLLATAS
ncbi:hypothetical protein [Streptomyces mirabilis]|uniref:hypothetical protein n=1 Tax=Streptomyces mirabilis TaxID=68239 RepID=UPI0036D11A7E